MKTKTLIVIAVLLMSATAIQAQVNFGIVAGPNFQNINGKDFSGDKLENGLIVGFHGGVIAFIPVATDFYFQPGILYSQKGGRSNQFLLATKSANSEFSTTLRISYLEMPLNLLYRPQFGNGHILVGFGPYIAAGIGGSQVYKYGETELPQKIKFVKGVEESDWDYHYAYYRRFDAGANIFAGYEMEMGLFFRLDAQLGLLNINSEYIGYDGNESALKNTGFGLSVGYNF